MVVWQLADEYGLLLVGWFNLLISISNIFNNFNSPVPFNFAKFSYMNTYLVFSFNSHPHIFTIS